MGLAGSAKDLGNRDPAALTSLDDLAGRLVAVELQHDVVNARRDLDPGRSSLTGVAAVEPDFRAFRERVDLHPGDVTAFRMKFRVDFCLPIGADFDLPDVGV